ncbi:MAG: hypothetical protein RLZZ165_1319 [Bacteroidota bacterium]
MLKLVLDTLKDGLDSYLTTRFRSGPTVVYPDLANVTSSSNPIFAQGLNLAVVKLQEDRTFRPSEAWRQRQTDNTVVAVKPPVQFQMTVIAVSNNKDYGTALDVLSATIQYFQRNNLYDSNNAPKLIDSPVDHFTVEFDHSDPGNHHVFPNGSSMAFLPSVKLLLRFLIFQEDHFNMPLSEVSEVVSDLAQQDS